MVKFTDTIRHFFFQAEDGIRDYKVTGVQTCALPISVNHIDATSDKLVARVLAEQRGGRIIGDVFGGTPGYLAQMTEQKLLAPLAIPEAAAYPAMLKGAEWVATDMQYFIAGWNTSLVKKGDEPKQFED